MKVLLITLLFSFGLLANQGEKAITTSNLGGGDIPANAVPGQCFAKVITPAKYQTTSEKIMTRPETTTYKTVAPKYGFVNETITVEEEREVLKVIPATYKWVEEKMLVKEAGTKLVKTAPKYKTVTKKIMVKPESTAWKKGEAGALDHSNTDGVLCLVKKPAVYKTVKETVMDVEAGVKEIEIPAVYKTVRKKVVDTPSRVEKKMIPAKTKIVKVKKLLEPAQKVPSTIPAKYKEITKRVLEAPSTTVWARILCKTNSNTNTVVEVQKALKGAGYNPGKIDGILGSDTARAIKKFQRTEGLSVGALTYDTLNKLNISM